jgi:hypothetical protein
MITYLQYDRKGATHGVTHCVFTPGQKLKSGAPTGTTYLGRANTKVVYNMHIHQCIMFITPHVVTTVTKTITS